MGHILEGRQKLSRIHKGVPPGNKGKKAMNKDGITKFFDSSEINARIAEGWKVGNTREYRNLTYTERQYVRQKTIEAMQRPEVKRKVSDSCVIEHNTKVLLENRHIEGEITKYESITMSVLCPIGFIYNKNLCINGVMFPYRPDFVNHKMKIIVEIDGSSHLGNYNRKRDNMKDIMMLSLGYSVYRFNNHFVEERLDDFKHDLNIILNGGDVNECVGLYSCKRVSIDSGTE